ncbi:hypothetical protein AB0758_46540 [Tolypothrix bouteillei VB521301_2]|uniref:hypothetical protein n=1 Tax=Tolypothrix bouteillei TaxID=1246981 RepID=UPI0038B46592
MNVEPGHPVSKNYQELIESLKDALTNREGIDSNKSGLTDFNEGSVILTIVHAVARELALIYKQIGVAYDSAFIDEATGIALDNVVALLGVKRRQASKAEGEVTFFRDKMTTKTITIRKNTRCFFCR